MTHFDGAMRATFALIVAVGLALASDGARAADPIDVGVAKIDITPTEPIRLSGYGSRTSESEGVATKLFARAMAIGAENPVVLITTDSIGIPQTITDRVVATLRETRGLARDQIAIGSTHTHGGPQIDGLLPYMFWPLPAGEEQATLEAYADRLVDQLVQIADEALADRKPAQVSFAIGEARIAHNRRQLRDGKWVGFSGNPDGPVDHDLPALIVRTPEGELRAVYVSYACHNTTLGGSFNQVHGDWAGVGATLAEDSHPGVTVLVGLGCGADQNPNPRGTVMHAEQHARTLADGIERVLKMDARPVEAPPIAAGKTVILPFDNRPTRELLEERVARAETSNNGFDQRYAHQARRYLKDMAAGLEVKATLPYRVQTWAFGDDLLMVFMPGEVVVDFGLRLKRELDADRLAVNAYFNDVPCYIPSKRLFPEGGYEIDRSMLYYDQPSRFHPSVEDTIVDAIHDLAPDRFNR